MNDEDLFHIYLKKLTTSLSILPDKPEETPINTLKALWATACDNPVSAIKVEEFELSELTKEAADRLDQLIAQRIDGVPLAHLTGRQSFLGLEMLAGPAALIPRKETELLAQTAIDIVNTYADSEINVVDVCTGAGNVALAIAKASSCAMVYASDLSVDAVQLAKKNANFLKLESRVSFYSGDLLESFESLDLLGKVHVLTCNPPYISTSKVSTMPTEISSYEPSLAFDGGVFGINLIRRLIVDAHKYLSENAYLILEVGLGQGDVIMKLIEKSNLYIDIKPVHDTSGNVRVIIAKINKE